MCRSAPCLRRLSIVEGGCRRRTTRKWWAPRRPLDVEHRPRRGAAPDDGSMCVLERTRDHSNVHTQMPARGTRVAASGLERSTPRRNSVSRETEPAPTTSSSMPPPESLNPCTLSGPLWKGIVRFLSIRKLVPWRSDGFARVRSVRAARRQARCCSRPGGSIERRPSHCVSRETRNTSSCVSDASGHNARALP